MLGNNRQYCLKSRPIGEVCADNFALIESKVHPPEEGHVQVKVLYASVDPAMRGWLKEGKSYMPPVGIGEVMRAIGIAKVMISQDPAYQAGDYVVGLFGIQEYVTANAKALFLNKIESPIDPITRYLSALGMPGMTAYFGLLDVGKVQAGETVVVSGAAGAVGSLVGQIAKIKGCRAIGIAGGENKSNYVVNELGFDACIDYKSENVRKSLEKHCPDGINIYFDNVGGDTLEDALANLAMHARIVICGAISQYNQNGPMKGPSNYMSLLVHRATMQGMVVFDYLRQYPEAIIQMAQWMKQGQLKAREHIVEGIENFPETLSMLFKGLNMGKLVLKIENDLQYQKS